MSRYRQMFARLDAAGQGAFVQMASYAKLRIHS